MAYEMVMPYHLHMPSYFLETFTEYPLEKDKMITIYIIIIIPYFLSISLVLVVWNEHYPITLFASHSTYLQI